MKEANLRFEIRPDRRVILSFKINLGTLSGPQAGNSIQLDWINRIFLVWCRIVFYILSILLILSENQTFMF
jgi:hypothetical protein